MCVYTYININVYNQYICYIQRENRVDQEESFHERQHVETYKKNFNLFHFLDYRINGALFDYDT